MVTDPYYATEQHYIHVRDFAEIDGVADAVRNWQPPTDLDRARLDIVKPLAQASVPGDYFTWRGFDAENAAARAAVQPLVDSLNTYLPRFMRARGSAAN